MAKKLILNPEVFNDPKMVGQSEYHAIYEILSSTVEQANDDETPKEETERLARAILEEFILIAGGLITDVEAHGATIEEKEN